MAGWLHFIAKEDYYVPKFIKEAQKFGVAVTVSLLALKKMEWGDRIGLLQVGGDSAIKSAVMFADFPVDRITGLSATAVAALTGKFRCMLVDFGGQNIRRGKSEHHTGFSYDIDAPLGLIAEALIDMEGPGKVRIGVPMIACMPDKIKPLEKPLPMFRDIIYRTGYAPFDIEEVSERIQRQRSFDPARRPRIPGQFYDPEAPDGEATTLEEWPGSISSVVILDEPG